MKTPFQWPVFLPFLLWSAPAQVTKAPPPLVLSHVTVIDATGAAAQPDMTVVITDGRIAEMGKSSAVHSLRGAQLIDATGKFLIPGLWDMHAHLDEKEEMKLFIANGVTGVRVMWGIPTHYEWRKEFEAGKAIGPRMMIASTIVDGPVAYWPYSISVKDEKQARETVDQIKKQGADFVKIYQLLTREEYFAIADESKKQGIPFEGHVPIAVSAEEASGAGQKSLEHMIGILPACSTRSEEILKAQQADLAEVLSTGKAKFLGANFKRTRQMMLDTYSPEKATALAATLKKNATWVCPTLTLLRMFGFGDSAEFRTDERVKYVRIRRRAQLDTTKFEGETKPPEDFAAARKEFAKDLEAVKALAQGGVGILAGTDAGNPYCFRGFSLHDELGLLVAAGLTPMKALQAATRNAATFAGREAELGTVEKGKTADLVLLDANPLEEIGNTKKIAAVVFGGKLYSRPELDAMLAEVAAFAGRQPIGNVMFSTAQEKGAEAAVKQYRELKATDPRAYDFSESELIGLGYGLISMKRYPDAILVFQLSVEQFPQSYNSWDSLAEAYMDNGDKELAIKNYRKSLEVNPKNTNAEEKLKQLGTE